MSDTVMLNVRMNRQTKERGCQVLERANLSVSDFVRRAFEHLDRTQEIPDFAISDTLAASEIEAKRQLLKSFAGCAPSKVGLDVEPLDARNARAMRLEEKYAEFLA